MQERKSIQTFSDLEVYQNVYASMLVVLKEFVPRLPKEERFDLADQMRRCCKAPPALIAEGFAKRYQPKHWNKYLTDAMGECYEMINHVSVCRDVYGSYIDVARCAFLLDRYDHACRQLTNLAKSWVNYHEGE